MSAVLYPRVKLWCTFPSPEEKLPWLADPDAQFTSMKLSNISVDAVSGVAAKIAASPKQR